MGFQTTQKAGNEFSPRGHHAQPENEVLQDQLGVSSGLPVPMIQRLTSCTCDGGCPRCTPIQAKLQIGQPGDKYEQEADRIADQVMRMPDPGIQNQANCDAAGGSACGEEEEIQPKLVDQVTPLVQRQVDEEEEEPEEGIQAKFDDGYDESLIQRQIEPEEEDEIQPKLVDQVTPLVQRQVDEEEEEPEEGIQAKFDDGYDESLIQRQIEPEEDEEVEEP